MRLSNIKEAKHISVNPIITWIQHRIDNQEKYAILDIDPNELQSTKETLTREFGNPLHYDELHREDWIWEEPVPGASGYGSIILTSTDSMTYVTVYDFHK